MDNPGTITLTHEDVANLTRPFPVEAHEFNRGFCYIAEEEVTARLDEIDPGWTFEIKSSGRGGTNNQFGIVSARLTIKGAYRESTGMQAVEYTGDGKGGKSDRESGEPEKGAVTDALRRCARLFGIGRYILKMGGDVKDKQQLAAWLNRHYPPQKPAQKPAAPAQQKQPEQQQREQDKPEPHFSDDSEKRQIIVNTAIKAGYLTQGQEWSDLLRLTDLTDEEVRKFPTGNDLGIHIKEQCEALKLELAKAQVSRDQARQSLNTSKGSSTRSGFMKSPFAPESPSDDAVPNNGSSATAFSRGLNNYQAQQEQQQTQAVIDDIDAALNRAMELSE